MARQLVKIGLDQVVAGTDTVVIGESITVRPIDEAGGIGLHKGGVLHLPFREPADEVRPSESNGNLDDLSVPATLTRPPVVTALTGYGRRFASGSGFEADDVNSAALRQRDLTVQALVKIDLAAQNTIATPGVIIGAGKAWQLFAEVVDLAGRVVRLKLWWDSIGGTHPEADGGADFVLAEEGWFLLTATRRWLGASNVRERYYANDVLLGEVTTTIGDIDGDAADKVTVGCRADGVGGYEYHMAGDIDGILVTEAEMSLEEVRQTYRRIAIFHAVGGEIVRASLPPGQAYSDDPDSGIQRELSVEGDAIGEALSLLEQLREDFSPARAWALLEDWERVTSLPPKLLDTLETRRARVLSFLRKVQGFTVDGVKDALAAAFDLAAGDVQVLEYQNRYSDDFAAGPASRWINESAMATSTAQLLNGADARWKLGTPLTLHYGIDGDERDNDPSLGVDVKIRLTGDTLQDGVHAGLVAFSVNNALWFGLYREAGTTKLGWRVYSGGAWSAVNELQSPATADIIRMRYDGGADWVLWYGTETGNQTGIAGIDGPSSIGFAMFADIAAIAGGNATVTLNDWRDYTPNGLRVYSWYAYRDPALSGTPDMPGARANVEKIKPAHTEASAVNIDAIECDDGASLCDDGPLA